MPSLTYSFLSPGEELELRTQLAAAYLAQADRAFDLIKDSEDQDAFEPARTVLEKLARSRPDFITTRLIKAVIANAFDDPVARETELAEVAFEWSCLGAQSWGIDLRPPSPDVGAARGWSMLEVAENKLTAIAADATTHETTQYATEGRTDSLAILIMGRIEAWATQYGGVQPLFESYRNLLHTAVVLDLIAGHQREVPDAIGGRNWRVFIISFALKSERLFTVSFEKHSCTFVLWGGAESTNVSAIEASILAGRLRGIQASSFMRTDQLESFSGRWGKASSGAQAGAMSPETQRFENKDGAWIDHGDQCVDGSLAKARAATGKTLPFRGAEPKWAVASIH